MRRCSMLQLPLPFVSSQVENRHCFGKGAVRFHRVKRAVTEFSCMDWWVALLTVVVFAAFAAVAVVVVGETNNLYSVGGRAAAWCGLAGVPLVMVTCAIKVCGSLKARSLKEATDGKHSSVFGFLSHEPTTEWGSRPAPSSITTTLDIVSHVGFKTPSLVDWR